MIADKAQHTHDQVRVLQRKLYRAAKEAPQRKFGVLYDKVYRRDVLEEAWRRVRRNRGSAGVDKQTIEAVEGYGVDRLLDELEAELREKRYRPQPVRRVYIPKPGKPGQQRGLGIPVVRDRVVQAAVKLVIEPVLEADFRECSYGFRPKRSAHDAIEEIRTWVTWGYRQVIDADLKACFTPRHTAPQFMAGRESSGCSVTTLIRKPFRRPRRTWSASLAALDTLQHRLARHAEAQRASSIGEIAWRRLFDEARPQLVGQRSARGARGRLFADNDPAVSQRCRSTPPRRGPRPPSDGQQVAVGVFGGGSHRGMCGSGADADVERRKAVPAGGAFALAIEDAGDHGVGVVRGEAADEREAVLVGADRGGFERGRLTSSSVRCPHASAASRRARRSSRSTAMVTSSSRPAGAPSVARRWSWAPSTRVGHRPRAAEALGVGWAEGLSVVALAEVEFALACSRSRRRCSHAASRPRPRGDARLDRAIAAFGASASYRGARR